ncbi:MAG: cupin domain-containing protein [Gemmatimonadaceae bacterium]
MKLYDPAQIAEDAPPPRADRPAMAIVHDVPDARLVVFRLEPGQQVAPHASSSTVILSVLAGSGLVSGVEGERSVRPGDVVAYAPDERHGMRALEHRLVVLATIAPRPA